MKALVLAACAVLATSCAERPATQPSDKPGPEVARIPAPMPPPPAALPRPSWPWSAIGRVNRQRGGFCSGLLIGPDKVLTTARCLWDARLGRWTSTRDLHFLAGYHLGKQLAHRRAKSIELPAQIAMTSRGIPRRATNDWAILTLNQPIAASSKIRPVQLARLGDRLRPNALGPLSRAGYGPARPHAIESARCKAVTLLNPKVLLHDCAVTSAQDGFPVLVKTPAGWRMLGFQMRGLNLTAARKRMSMILLVTAMERPRQRLF
jgi:protease YdgD